MNYTVLPTPPHTHTCLRTSLSNSILLPEFLRTSELAVAPCSKALCGPFPLCCPTSHRALKQMVEPWLSGKQNFCGAGQYICINHCNLNNLHFTDEEKRPERARWLLHSGQLESKSHALSAESATNLISLCRRAEGPHHHKSELS